MRTILVIGSNRVDSQKKRFEDLGHALGKMVVRHRFCLLTAGDRYPVIDEFAALGAQKYCATVSWELSSRVRSIHRPGVEPHGIGASYSCHGESELEQVLELSERAHAIVVVGGGPNTREYIVAAEATKKPVIPIPTVGGIAKECWRRYIRGVPDYLPKHVKLADFKELSQVVKSTADAERLGEVAIALAKMAFPDSNYIFVATPFSSAYDHTMEAIRHAVEELNADDPESTFIVQRLDTAEDAGRIDETVEACIRRASIMIADVSEQNPNVLYEYGYALGRGVEVVPIATKGTKLPVDIRNRITKYYNLSASDNTLKDSITEFGKALAKCIKAVLRSME
jgi:nucleoside 2-deoxyribosyltransferase